MKKTFKTLMVVGIISIAFSLVFSTVVLAGGRYTPVTGVPDNTYYHGETGLITNNIGQGNVEPKTIMANLLNIILGFLGILAVIIILLGGFKWMTAAGNEDKVAEAKRLIAAGIIGLIIIIAAFSIAAFVINQLWNVTAGN